MNNKHKIQRNRPILLTDILSKNVLLPGESQYELQKIREKTLKDVVPIGALEEILFSKVVADTWKLRRLYVLETSVLRDQQIVWAKKQASENEFSLEVYRGDKALKRFRSTAKQLKYTKQLEDIQRHQTSLESSLIKTISELKDLQKVRLKNKN